MSSTIGRLLAAAAVCTGSWAAPALDARADTQRSYVLRGYTTPYPYSRCRLEPVVVAGVSYYRDTCTGQLQRAGSQSSPSGGGKGL
jgi:hypothetical protein